MSTELVCCRADDDVRDVSELMQSRQIRRVPIVDERGACIGIVAMADLAVKAPREGQAGEAIQEVSQPVKAA
jgi:predicted transcriptional regulator